MFACILLSAALVQNVPIGSGLSDGVALVYESGGVAQAPWIYESVRVTEREGFDRESVASRGERRTYYLLEAPGRGPAPVALQQDADSPCRAIEIEAAAFLVGEWTVTLRERAPSEAGGWRERTGTSVWERRVGGCAFVESISLGDAYREMRLLAYDRRAEEWTLAIVDSDHGNIVTMAGRQLPRGIEFTSAQTRRGRLLLDRLVYRAESAERVDVRTETSSDAGESWTTLVETQYTRKLANGWRPSTAQIRPPPPAFRYGDALVGGDAAEPRWPSLLKLKSPRDLRAGFR